MSKASEREETVSILSKEGVPLDVIRSLLRAGTTLHRLAELECSSEAADRDQVPCPGDFKNGGGCLCRDYGSWDAVPNQIAPPRKNYPHPMTSPHARPRSPRWRLFWLFLSVYLAGMLIGVSLTAYQMRGRLEVALEELRGRIPEGREITFRHAGQRLRCFVPDDDQEATPDPAPLWQSAGWRGK